MLKGNKRFVPFWIGAKAKHFSSSAGGSGPDASQEELGETLKKWESNLETNTLTESDQRTHKRHLKAVKVRLQVILVAAVL